MPRFSKLARTTSCIATPAITSPPLHRLPYTPLSASAGVAAAGTEQSHCTRSGLLIFVCSSLSYAANCDPHEKSRKQFCRGIEPGNGSGYQRRNAKYLHTARHLSSQTIEAYKEKQVHSEVNQTTTNQERHAKSQNIETRPPGSGRPGFFGSSTQVFARNSTLPLDFYSDLERVAGVKFDKEALHMTSKRHASLHDEPSSELRDQMQLLQSVRDLEKKLSDARSALDRSLKTRPSGKDDVAVREHALVMLSKQDYLNLVDLYYYSSQSRFGPDSPDKSPTPLFLDDYSFELSRDFSEPMVDPTDYHVDEEDISPLKDVEEMLKSRQIKEISLMQAFVNLLLDDTSSNRALFEVYKMFPEPGVAYLPTGMVRLFLQRMSTPYRRSEESMLRYLSLMDDMQRANLRITQAEWSSAIYMAGRSFGKVTEGDVSKSFGIWREMEEGAGVRATHVTFNILFDIAVRAEKYALAQNVLKEMHERGLRLNRLGRVSLIYYHGLRGDGDGIRRAYRDFVEAGEIVDTLVLNCVMASLIKAQEPVAAEQIYERMKQLQSRLRSGVGDDGQEALFMKYPPPGSTQIDMQMASNSLGRVLLNAANLRKGLPEKHLQLQASMPLTPDQITFRSMISHHASTSGDLDRLTVLLNDKTQMIGLPLTSLDFQLLFKGFAVHGESQAEEKWTVKRLQLVWDACRSYIKKSQQRRPEGGIELPTIKDAESAVFTPGPVSSLKKPDAWEEFILDLAAFPRERLKRPVPFSKTFFPEDADPEQPARTADVDKETEYSLPEAENLHPQYFQESLQQNVEATRNLVIWLLRAYARCTRSRRKLEEVWFQVRKLWKPKDNLERDAVVKVLRRALRDSDHSGVM
jgi:hypothetical protein